MNAAIYTRISLDRDGDALGVARQEKECRQLAKQRQWSVAEVYSDNDLSGSKRKVQRPAYERLLADIAAKKVEALLVWDLDRLTRQPRQLEEFVDVCNSVGMHNLATVSGDVNMGTGDGLLVARIKGAVAAEESRKLGQRVASKAFELAEDGKPYGGGRRPYGFADNRIDHDEHEVAAIHRAVAVILNGGTLATAAAEMGVHPSSAKRLLCAPRMVGMRAYKGQTLSTAVWTPIIDEADWERLKGLLDRPTRYSVPIKHHLLSGFARCGECDATLSAQHKKNPERTVYVCRSARGGCGKVAVDAGHLERTVVDEVGGWFASPRVRRAVQRHLDGTPDEREADLLAAITADEQRLTGLAGQVGELEITAAEWAAMRRPIVDRIEDARAELGKLHRRPSYGKIDVDRIAAEWEDMTDGERRENLRDLGVDVVVARAGKGARRFNSDRVRVTPSWA